MRPKNPRPRRSLAAKMGCVRVPNRFGGSRTRLDVGDDLGEVCLDGHIGQRADHVRRHRFLAEQDGWQTRNAEEDDGRSLTLS